MKRTEKRIFKFLSMLLAITMLVSASMSVWSLAESEYGPLPDTAIALADTESTESSPSNDTPESAPENTPEAQEPGGDADAQNIIPSATPAIEESADEAIVPESTPENTPEAQEPGGDADAQNIIPTVAPAVEESADEAIVPEATPENTPEAQEPGGDADAQNIILTATPAVEESASSDDTSTDADENMPKADSSASASQPSEEMPAEDAEIADSGISEEMTAIYENYFTEEAGTFVLLAAPVADIISGNDCAHEDMEVNYIFDQTSSAFHDASRHRLIGKLTKIAGCMNCSYSETWEYNTDANLFEGHSFDDAYICAVCGYEAGFTSCAHADTFEEIDTDEPRVTDVNGSRHCIAYMQYIYEICSVCGEIVNEHAGEQRTEWADHEFFQGENSCLVCEYESACSHENLRQHTRTSIDKDSWLEIYYFLNDEDAATHLIYTIEGKESYHSCTSCGAIILTGEESYFMDLTVTTQAHDYGDGNRCLFCGHSNDSNPEAEAPCTHAQYTATNQIANEYTVFLNSEKHAHRRHTYVQATCNACGASFVADEYDQQYATANHSFSVNYNTYIAACSKCEYQYALSAQEARSALNGDCYKIIDYIPPVEVFDYRNIAYMVYLNKPKGAATAGHAAMLFIDANGNGFYFSLNGIVSEDASGLETFWQALSTDAYVAVKYLVPEEVEKLLTNGTVKGAINTLNESQNDSGYSRWLIKERIEQFSTARFVAALNWLRDPGNYALLFANCDDAALSLYATEEEFNRLAYGESGELMPNYTFEKLLELGNYDYKKTHETNGLSDFLNGFKLRSKPAPFGS